MSMNIWNTKIYKIFERLFRLDLIPLFCINVIIYIVALYVELNYLYSNSYYYKILVGKLSSPQKILQEIAAQKGMDIYNYLWIPVHVLLTCLLIGICIFLGFNIINLRLQLKDSFRLVMACSFVFPVNYLVSVILKIVNIVSYNEYNIDDEYAYQSVVSIFNASNIPIWEYSILRQINITEIIFILFLSVALSQRMQIKFSKSVIDTTIIYTIGLTIYGIVSVFAGYILT
ncbi:hypothetical protein XylorDRAFT_0089 [Xylanibacter oryzae DSM 17970]|uniref:Yip1 domain-containing protein n=1 Tax=Xylanibacter oryzae DSM 17970 TaxID=915438 RepID=A0ABP3BG42_9BACT|nr:hypothetical protein [Xylanibacter oryzae]EXG77744.1 hypothetical protein XylorDRAFT_0089 [Xylanibacter oryzae DSM 17970]